MNPPVVLITGAARRIGAEISRALHQAGFRVVLHHRASASEASELAANLNGARKDSALCLQGDLTQSSEVTQLAQQTLNAWGRVDLLVNNASCFYSTPLEEADEEQWDDLMAVNLKAPFFLAQALAPALTASRGSIINIADIHGQRPLAAHSIYSIAKAANIMLTKTLALELAPHVRVNGIAPGAILWPELNNGTTNDETLKKIPLGSLGAPENIARAVVFLAAKDSYITGEILNVDGGRSLRQ